MTSYEMEHIVTALLERSKSPSLAKKVAELPPEMIEGLYRRIQHDENRNAGEALVTFHVVHDVSLFINGGNHKKMYCFEFSCAS